MSKIINYRLIVSSNVLFFEKLIIEVLAAGWVLHGQPFSRDDQICQAMIKYADENADIRIENV